MHSDLKLNKHLPGQGGAYSSLRSQAKQTTIGMWHISGSATLVLEYEQRDIHYRSTVIEAGGINGTRCVCCNPADTFRLSLTTTGRDKRFSRASQQIERSLVGSAGPRKSCVDKKKQLNQVYNVLN